MFIGAFFKKAFREYINNNKETHSNINIISQIINQENNKNEISKFEIQISSNLSTSWCPHHNLNHYFSEIRYRSKL